VLFSPAIPATRRSASPANPDGPTAASSPWVTSVGGTSLGVSRQRPRVRAWMADDSLVSRERRVGSRTYIYGPARTSRLFRQPVYQAGVVPDALSKRYGGPAMRVVPDISTVGIRQALVARRSSSRTGRHATPSTGLAARASRTARCRMLAVAMQRRGGPSGSRTRRCTRLRPRARTTTHEDRSRRVSGRGRSTTSTASMHRAVTGTRRAG